MFSVFCPSPDLKILGLILEDKHIIYRLITVYKLTELSFWITFLFHKIWNPVKVSLFKLAPILVSQSQHFFFFFINNSKLTRLGRATYRWCQWIVQRFLVLPGHIFYYFLTTFSCLKLIIEEIPVQHQAITWQMRSVMPEIFWPCVLELSPQNYRWRNRKEYKGKTNWTLRVCCKYI